MTALNVISNLFFVLGAYFMFAAMVGFMRYSNFYVRLHTVSLFSIYGANLVLLSIGISIFKPIIFFEMICIIILNTICTLSVIHILFRNAILNGVEYAAKTREEILKLKQKEKEEFYSSLKASNKKKEEIKKMKEKARQQKEEEKNKLRQKKEEEARKKMKEKELIKNSIKNNNNLGNNIVEDRPTENNVVSKVDNNTNFIEPEKNITTNVNTENNNNEEKSDVEKENEELKKKIKEQKKILRKKIETIRRNAFITRKPEEIDKAEQSIKEVLDKYNLTEEMLKDDDEQENK